MDLQLCQDLKEPGEAPLEYISYQWLYVRAGFEVHNIWKVLRQQKSNLDQIHFLLGCMNLIFIISVIEGADEFTLPLSIRMITFMD